MEDPSNLERFYLGDIELGWENSDTPKMVLQKTSNDEIQFRFDVEGLKNRSALVHPHLLALKRFSINQNKVSLPKSLHCII